MHKPTTISNQPPLPITGTGCPYEPPQKSSPQSSTRDSTLSKLNPLNYMPSYISQERAENQKILLPLEREPSSIPKGDGTGNWEYPSPQQMYNAMLRKGYTDTPEDAVESMVAVHNFLNEGAWAEIVEWERRFARGLAQGWQECRRGEDGIQARSGSPEREPEAEAPEPRLVRFMGRPGDTTPRAKMLQVMGWMYPSRFSCEPPFDRHDWYIQRHLPDGRQVEVRYVIDYYSGPPEPTGEPVFYLDVRPAVDTPSAAVARMMRWSGDVWWRASGGKARETTP